ncbi:hypothetical protein BE04_33455 [Sorangium cellulosum]|uniref:Secreted protein n=3 Tax=Sorangium cellulosum TaxID=56 RepID=A0A150PX77_SORCE|nr:hypothetical protein SCE1572_18795 [Sorangium cellulosum So0157-2]KYF59988.1 hypothetical protein BE04_33455 [Sorangium cellulosum]
MHLRAPIFLTLLLVTGCGSNASINTSAQKTLKASPANCEIAVQLLDARAPKKVTFMSEPACMQAKGSALTFPTTMTLHYKERLGPPYDRDLCADEAVGPETTKGDKLYSCQWNGTFRDRHPMTFRIFSAHTPAANDAPLDIGTRIQLIHVFRNGKLVFKWLPPALPVTEVLIHGSAIEGEGIPHLAPLDVRVYPVGADVSADLLALDVSKSREQLKTRLAVATSAAVATGVPRTNDSVKCLVMQIDLLRQTIATEYQLGPVAALSTPADKCDVEGSQDLVVDYQNAKAKGREALERFAGAVSAELGVRRQVLIGQIDSLVAAAPPGLAARKAALAQDLKLLDALITDTATILDGAVNALDVAVKEARALARDPQKAAEVHAKVAEALTREGDFFEPYGTNPEPTGHERMLEMTYRDAFQWYFLQPWNGLPMRTDGEITPSPTIAIPVIDVVGLRYQWAASRFAELRIAPFASMVLTDSAGGNDKDDGPDVIRWAWAPSVSIGNLRMGLAILPFANEQGNAARYVRFVFGADLYKLITGTAIEAL